VMRWTFRLAARLFDRFQDQFSGSAPACGETNHSKKSHPNRGLERLTNGLDNRR